MKTRIQEIAVTKTPERKSRGRKREDASFPVAPLPSELPVGYAAALGEIKRRIQGERLRTVMAANSAMVMPVLGHWSADSGASGARGMGRQGHRPTLRRSARVLPGHERPIPA